MLVGRQITAWTVRCDGCGVVHELADGEDGLDIAVIDGAEALELASLDGWTGIDGTDEASLDMCPKCAKARSKAMAS